MNRSTRVSFVAIVLLTLVALAVAVPFPGKSRIPILSGFGIKPGIDLAGGAELRYKVLFKPGYAGDRKGDTRLAADVLRRRLDGKQLQEPRLTTSGDDAIVVRLPGIDADELAEVKRLIVGIGDLKLYAAAPEALQEQYGKDRVVPDGYKAVGYRGRSTLLVLKTPVIEGRHILRAEPEQEFAPGGARWVALVELDADGARRFDEAAERLYPQRGRIVIVLDDVVRSAPVVQSPAFHGRVRISIGKE
jgi:SecD/SecF fusion protein